MTKLFPEPHGYEAIPGYVKCNPDNNDYYIDQFKGDPWYDILLRTHERLNSLVPNYNISQIKEKFGGLRYYYDLPDINDIDLSNLPKYITGKEDVISAIYDEFERIIRYAEAYVDGMETFNREYYVPLKKEHELALKDIQEYSKKDC